MKSKWYRLKKKALELRKAGWSTRSIEIKLGIPRSTLSGWFKEIILSKKQRQKLYKKWKMALVKARTKAVMWHNKQKEIRLLEAKNQAELTLKNIPIHQKEIIDLALASLYLGEGFKKTTETGMGNSDPLILNFFITALIKNYNLPISKIKCELHLRADQSPKKMKEFWSKKLNIPLENFTSISVDKRTIGSPTYPDYNGVCVVRCGTVAIQRKLVYLIKSYYKNIIES